MTIAPAFDWQSPENIQDIKDILILSNGPGELTTWVYPFLTALAKQPMRSLRVSIVLSPCQNASGNEAELAQSFPNVARVMPHEQFFKFLLWGITPNWQWSKQGIVIFLGGDQFFTLAIAKRLGYKTLIYAEWEARWYRWIDLFAVRNENIAHKVPLKFRSKAMVIGDLMVDRPDAISSKTSSRQRICLMPGSKPVKLQIAVPLMLATADILRQKRPDLEFVIPLAPTVSPERLIQYAQIEFPTPDSVGSTATLVNQQQLITGHGTVVELYQEFPAHDLLQSSQICLTTVGANTAELASLQQPMIILLPTNIPDLKVGWDGLLGIIAGLPILDKFLSKLINQILVAQIQKKGQLLAWPNIWAKEEIVPELLGMLTPTIIADRVLFYLDHPDELTKMRDRLKQVCGQSGAATKLVDIAISALS